jgi:hypothetical protein
MERLYTAEQRPFDQIRGVAIAIREVDPNQRHIGLLYRDSVAKVILFLHLGWHFDLRHEPPRDNYFWVDPAITTRRLVQVAAICRLVWRANGRKSIPYGFGPPSDTLDAATGRYLFGPAGFGLTCATFVFAVFHRAGLDLVRYSTWPLNRPGDVEWQRLVVDNLRNDPNATAEHIRAVENDVGTTARYRPEEVAGAATLSRIPAEFRTVERCGRQILLRMRNRNSTASPQTALQLIAWPFRAIWGWISSHVLDT